MTGDTERSRAEELRAIETTLFRVNEHGEVSVSVPRIAQFIREMENVRVVDASISVQLIILRD